MKKTFLLYAILLAGCTARDVPLQPGPEEDVLFDHTLFADASLERAVQPARRIAYRRNVFFMLLLR